MNQSVPIPQKIALTIREAAEYSNIGINRIERMLKEPNCPFALSVGANDAKRLVKRVPFEQYLNQARVI